MLHYIVAAIFYSVVINICIDIPHEVILYIFENCIYIYGYTYPDVVYMYLSVICVYYLIRQIISFIISSKYTSHYLIKTYNTHSSMKLIVGNSYKTCITILILNAIHDRIQNNAIKKLISCGVLYISISMIMHDVDTFWQYLCYSAYHANYITSMIKEVNY